MTVKELIEKLQALPQDAEIYAEDYDEDRWTIVKIEFTGEYVVLTIEGDSFI